ncbi:MAG: TIGR02710 family CRISPR-associated CARF protein [Bryobacterales bacterium]|nr:TIGR02710 family CRISPR-associated CARF protein [Bryobacteraceae bacterium]MDW8130072.1 TIGR02710 family CRISPR-associated CARF protein [Bryobacterales bacterium]
MKGAVLSVGGSEQPIIKALTWHPAEFVLFVVSEQSVAQVKDKILPALDYQPQYELLRVNAPDDLGTCYEQCRKGIRDWLERRGLSGDDVYFDNTGGTKPMSSALAMAAMEWIRRYHYVSGQRDKGELGVVISGTERPIEGVNPWIEMGLRQRQLAQRFYELGYAEQAAALLDEAARHSERQRGTIKAYAALCRLLGKLDRLKFDTLLHDLGPWKQALEVAFEHAENREALAWLRGLHDYFKNLQEESKKKEQHPNCLRELLASARRRARQMLYDEAVARLYRAVELYGQDRLYRAFGARLGKVRPTNLSPELAQAFRQKFPQAWDEQEGCYKLGLKNLFAALALSPCEEDKALAKAYEKLHPPLQKRNESWLAHGTRPATSEDFQEFWSAVLEVLGIGEDTLPEWPRLSFVD